MKLIPESVPSATQVDRRTVGKWTLGAAAMGWAGLGSQTVPAAQALASEPWAPKLFEPRQAQMVERLVEALIPATDTPGAAAVGVHRYLDEALSVEKDGPRERFLDGLEWLRRYAKEQTGRRWSRLEDEQLIEVLQSISDDAPAAAAEDSDLEPGRRFFRDLKERTIFGYYTSREARVEELGYPEGANTTRWVGCPHAEGYGEA